MEHTPQFPEPVKSSELFDRLQREQLEREAYPRRHWEHARDAYEGMYRRLSAGVGPWMYDPELLTVTHINRRYQIDLERLTTPAELLDILLQVATKTAGKSEAFGALVALLEAICEEIFQNTLRGVFCAADQPHTVQWPRARKAADNDGEES
ncbi:MAG TPA: hypothetical protein VIH59_25560 [Candidatus Tectomicrobia bacterium]